MDFGFLTHVDVTEAGNGHVAPWAKVSGEPSTVDLTDILSDICDS
jgi:hypothetical protein